MRKTLLKFSELVQNGRLLLAAVGCCRLLSAAVGCCQLRLGCCRLRLGFLGAQASRQQLSGCPHGPWHGLPVMSRLGSLPSAASGGGRLPLAVHKTRAWVFVLAERRCLRIGNACSARRTTHGAFARCLLLSFQVRGYALLRPAWLGFALLHVALCICPSARTYATHTPSWSWS